MQYLYATGPKNHCKVIIGKVDIPYRQAIFYINEKRLFRQAADSTGAVGIDKNVFERKIVQFCDKLMFKMWTGEIYEINKEDFIGNAWLYPAAGSEKAPRTDFIPKLMLELETLKKLSVARKQDRDDEILKAALS